MMSKLIITIDINANDLVFSVISETDSLYGDNVQLNPLLNYENNLKLLYDSTQPHKINL